MHKGAFRHHHWHCVGSGYGFGYFFLDLSPGYKTDLMSYLFRSILAVPSGNLILMLILNLIIISIVTLFYRQLQAIPFDKNSAFVVGVQVDKLYLLLIGMVALTVVNRLYAY